MFQKSGPSSADSKNVIHDTIIIISDRIIPEYIDQIQNDAFSV